MNKRIVLTGLFLGFVFQTAAFAQGGVSLPAGAVGSVTFLEGVSDIERGGKGPEFIKEKEPVYINDIVRTKNYSKAEITFLDKSVLKLAPDSSVSIAEYKLDDKNKREHSRVKLTRGRIEAIVSRTGAPDTFVVDTPNMEGAVKGSDIFFSYLGGKTGVFVLDGAISVMNPALPGSKIKVTKDNCVVVPFNSAPGEVRTVRDAEIEYFKSSVQPAFVKKWVPAKDSAQMNGVIVSVAGTVRIYKKGAANWREPKINEAVSEGDKIQTEENSTIEIRMSNGNTVVLQPFTEMSFTTLRHDPATGSYENTLTVNAGRLSAVVTRTKDQLAFQVQTPSAVCGVRGTFMEVVVAPAQGAQASGQAQQPVTQVFFEGGNGYITSTLTGQTQEIGAGQNGMVDITGNVSAPVETSPEQRSTMFQTWTSAQTMNNYSAAEGATGVGSNAQQQPLPQPVVGTAMQGIENVTAVNEDIQTVIDETSVLDLDTLNPEPVINPIYSDLLSFVEGTGVGITGGKIDLTAFDNNTWVMSTNGTWSDVVFDVVEATFASGTASLEFVGYDPEGGDSGNWEGALHGYISTPGGSIEVAGTAKGTYVETEPDKGTFQGAGAGVWIPVE